MLYRLTALVLLFSGLACSFAQEQDQPFKTGAETLVHRQFASFDSQRVGLIANHTAQVDSAHLVDLFHGAENVKLTAIFGPEHGLRGKAAAGESVTNGIDNQTGVPVYSLYGQHRKPTAQMLANVDVLVFDIQDIGARFYTYISTMGLAMQAAAAQEIPFVVLDRPNPLGDYVSGFVLDTTQTSFVGMYPIPVAHGMTVGELARMIKGEALLPGLEQLELTVVPMQGWQRSDGWPGPKTTWIPPSPNIPDLATAQLYPGAAFVEGTTFSEGRGTYSPFKKIGASWADGQQLAHTLNNRGLPGIRFEAVEFTPQPIPNMAPHPKLEAESLSGVTQTITDPAAFQPVETGIHLLHAFYQQASAKQKESFFRSRWLAKLAGTQRLQTMLEKGRSPAAITNSWQQEVAAFKKKRQPYLLYSD